MKKTLLMAADARAGRLWREEGRRRPPPTPPRWPPPRPRPTPAWACRTTRCRRFHDGPGHHQEVSCRSCRRDRAPGIARGPLSFVTRPPRPPPNGTATTGPAGPPATTRSPGPTSRRNMPSPSMRSSSASVERTLPTSLSPSATARPSSGSASDPAQPAELAVGVPAEVEPGHRLLARVAALGVGDAPDLVVPHFLRKGPLVDLGAERGPAPRAAARRGGRPPRPATAPAVTSRAIAGSTAGASPTARATNGADLGRQGHRHRAQVAADRGHPARRFRAAYARLGQHLEPVRAEQPGHGRLAGEIGRPGEARRQRAGEELDHGPMPAERHDEREAVALPEHPGVHHDHPLGREQRAVHQAPVARLLEIVGEKPLQARQRARPGDPENGRGGGDDGRPVADLIEPRAVEPEIEIRHGPKAARRDRGR